MKTEIILSHDEIMAKVREIAAELDVEYADKNPIMVGIMKGSLYFLSDLTKEMSIPLQIDVMNLSSYGDSSKSSGVVKECVVCERRLSVREGLGSVREIVELGGKVIMFKARRKVF